MSRPRLMLLALFPTVVLCVSAMRHPTRAAAEQQVQDHGIRIGIAVSSRPDFTGTLLKDVLEEQIRPPLSYVLLGRWDSKLGKRAQAEGVRYVIRIKAFDIKKGTKKTETYEGFGDVVQEAVLIPATGEALLSVYDVAGRKPKEIASKSFTKEIKSAPLSVTATESGEPIVFDGPAIVSLAMLKDLVRHGTDLVGARFARLDAKFLMPLYQAGAFSFLNSKALRPLSELPRYELMDIFEIESAALRAKKSTVPTPGRCLYCGAPDPQNGHHRCSFISRERMLLQALERLYPRVRRGEDRLLPEKTLASAPSTIESLREEWSQRARSVRLEPFSVGWVNDGPQPIIRLTLIVVSEDPPDPGLVESFLHDDEFAARLQARLVWMELGGKQAKSAKLKKGVYLVKSRLWKVIEILESKRKLKSLDLGDILRRIVGFHPE